MLRGIGTEGGRKWEYDQAFKGLEGCGRDLGLREALARPDQEEGC